MYSSPVSGFQMPESYSGKLASSPSAALMARLLEFEFGKVDQTFERDLDAAALTPLSVINCWANSAVGSKRVHAD